MEASIADVFSFVKDGVNGFVEAAGFGENVIGAVAAQGAAFVKKVPAFTEAAQLATDASATTRLVAPCSPAQRNLYPPACSRGFAAPISAPRRALTPPLPRAAAAPPPPPPPPSHGSPRA